MHGTTLPRTLLTGVAVATVGVTLLASASGASAIGTGSGPLAGTWTSVDTDLSHQTLDIVGAGDRVYSMVYDDDVASDTCGDGPARLSGPGFVDGDDVLMVAALVCLPGGNPFRGRLAVGFHYDSGADTLVDDFGVVWSRAG
jgi:hypothetical protein